MGEKHDGWVNLIMLPQSFARLFFTLGRGFFYSSLLALVLNFSSTGRGLGVDFPEPANGQQTHVTRCVFLLEKEEEVVFGLFYILQLANTFAKKVLFFKSKAFTLFNFCFKFVYLFVVYCFKNVIFFIIFFQI